MNIFILDLQIYISMCLDSRKIRNRVMPEHETGFDYHMVEVPCNSCPDCRLKRSNDWLVRGFFEFQHNHSQAFFITLDYDNCHLPVYDIKKKRLLLPPEQVPSLLDGRLPSHLFPCFDMSHLKTFFSRLRFYLGKFRYMFSCDYGGFLRRPHYHLILLPETLTSEPLLFHFVNKCWNFGSHEKLDVLPSVSGDKLRALSYIVSYVTKEFTFNLSDYEKDLPCRYRYQVHASKGFGLQAIENGYITWDMIKEGKSISIPCGKNGTLLNFKVPRYYEMKFTHNYTWDRAEGKAYLLKNQDGIELSQIRHNSHYIQYIKNFFASRHDSHAALGLDWYQTVMDVMSDFEHFKEYCWLRPFVKKRFNDLFIVHLSFEDTEIQDSRFARYESVLHKYDEYKKDINRSKLQVKTERMREEAKQRAYATLSNNPQKYRYLLRKGVLNL